MAKTWLDLITPYQSGDHADGGDFTFTDTTNYDGGTFKQMDNYHHIYALNQSTIGTDDVVITGIQVEDTISSDDEYSVLFGSQGYVLSISNNPLIQSKEDATTIANTVGAKIVGMRFRPFSANILSDPSVEAGDPCYVSIRTGRGYDTYQTFITSLSYTVSENQNIKCDAETPSRNQSVKFDASTKTIVEARKQAKQELSNYDLEQQRFNNLVFHSFGLYRTEEVLEDGSTIEYAHDKPTLAESQNIWRQSANAFTVSNDGGLNWRGMDADGNIIANVLNTVGINAEWITTGTIAADKVQIGGTSDGVLRVKDTNDRDVVLLNKDGIVLDNGAKLIGQGGVLSVFQYVSSGTGLSGAEPTHGWGHCGILGSEWDGYWRNTIGIRTYIPSNFTITSASIQVGHMPVYAEHFDSADNVISKWKQGRNLRIYSSNSTNGRFYYYANSSDSSVVWSNNTDITSGVFGVTSWSPALQYSGSDQTNKSNLIQYRNGNIKNYLTAGQIQTFVIQTTDAPTYTNYTVNECLMQIVITVEGYKY